MNGRMGMEGPSNILRSIPKRSGNTTSEGLAPKLHIKYIDDDDDDDNKIFATAKLKTSGHKYSRLGIATPEAIGPIIKYRRDPQEETTAKTEYSKSGRRIDPQEETTAKTEYSKSGHKYSRIDPQEETTAKTEYSKSGRRIIIATPEAIGPINIKYKEPIIRHTRSDRTDHQIQGANYSPHQKR
eukprot:jgi/Psemu1/17181/gm1.17181_g